MKTDPVRPARIRTIRKFPGAVFASTLQFLVLAFVLGWFLLQRADSIGYNWQWYRIPPFLLVANGAGISAGPLVKGLQITLLISFAGLILSFCIGILTALLRLSDSLVGRILVNLYIELSRNTPLLIQLFLIYFVLGPIIGLDRFTAAILALSLFEGAYTSEILRAGIVAVPYGQIEAARSLGLSMPATYRHIILPQALRIVMPPLTSQAISLIKDSALVSTIAIYDLTMRAQALIAETYLTFEIWFTVAAMYFILTFSLSLVVGFLEKRLKLP